GHTSLQSFIKLCNSTLTVVMSRITTSGLNLPTVSRSSSRGPFSSTVNSLSLARTLDIPIYRNLSLVRMLTLILLVLLIRGLIGTSHLSKVTTLRRRLMGWFQRYKDPVCGEDTLPPAQRSEETGRRSASGTQPRG